MILCSAVAALVVHFILRRYDNDLLWTIFAGVVFGIVVAVAGPTLLAIVGGGVEVDGGVDAPRKTIEALALIGGGLFVVYKLWSGVFGVNLTLRLDTERAAATKSDDFLSVTVHVEKGDLEPIHMISLESRVTAPPDATSSQECRFVGITKREYDKGFIEWNSTSDKKIHFAGGESTQFACVVRVAHGVPAQIEVILLGERVSSGYRTTWHASAMSLPKTSGE